MYTVFKICALRLVSILHRGSLQYCIENWHGRLNGIRATNSNKNDEAEINLHRTMDNILMTFQGQTAKVNPTNITDDERRLGTSQ